jgi:hypothetical protein
MNFQSVDISLRIKLDLLKTRSFDRGFSVFFGRIEDEVESHCIVVAAIISGLPVYIGIAGKKTCHHYFDRVCSFELTDRRRCSYCFLLKHGENQLQVMGVGERDIGPGAFKIRLISADMPNIAP